MTQLTRRQILAAPAVLAGRNRRPNVLWLMTDEQRPDSLGCYGSAWAHSPRLDELAANGTIFENAYTPSPVCVPCRSSLITGNSASSNGVLHNQARLRPGTKPLTWRFEDAGYQTATFGKKHFFLPGARPAFQTEAGSATDGFVDAERYGKGFDLTAFDVLQYEPAPDQKEKRRWILAGKFPVDEDRSAEARNVALALDWLSHRDQTKAFFLRVSLNAPHTPVVCPPAYLRMVDPAKIHLPFPTEAELAGQPKREAALLRGFQGTERLTRTQLQKARHYYYARAAFVDAMLGRLLDSMRRLQALDNTIVAFVSDHGTHLGDHGLLQKQTFYEQVARVPFVFAWAGGVRPGVRLRAPVSTLSLLPTLLELAGLPTSGIDGRSLAPQLSGGTESPREPVFSEIAFGYQGYRDADRQVMVRDGNYKLVLFPDGGDPDGALYDLLHDPDETRNLYSDPGQRAAVGGLLTRIGSWDRRRPNTR